MNYDPIFSPEAEEDFWRLPPPIQNLVSTHLRKLAASPTTMSRPSSFPYIEKAMRSDLDDDSVFDGRRHYIAILFRYGQDERTLEIIAIATNPPYDKPTL